MKHNNYCHFKINKFILSIVHRIDRFKKKKKKKNIFFSYLYINLFMEEIKLSE